MDDVVYESGRKDRVPQKQRIAISDVVGDVHVAPFDHITVGISTELPLHLVGVLQLKKQNRSYETIHATFVVLNCSFLHTSTYHLLGPLTPEIIFHEAYSKNTIE